MVHTTYICASAFYSMNNNRIKNEIYISKEDANKGTDTEARIMCLQTSVSPLNRTNLLLKSNSDVTSKHSGFLFCLSNWICDSVSVVMKSGPNKTNIRSVFTHCVAGGNRFSSRQAGITGGNNIHNTLFAQPSVRKRQQHQAKKYSSIKIMTDRRKKKCQWKYNAPVCLYHASIHTRVHYYSTEQQHQRSSHSKKRKRTEKKLKRTFHHWPPKNVFFSEWFCAFFLFFIYID